MLTPFQLIFDSIEYNNWLTICLSIKPDIKKLSIINKLASIYPPDKEDSTKTL